MQNSNSTQNYGKARLEKYELTEQDGFSYNKAGNVEILYRYSHGGIVTYDARHNSKKKAPDVFRDRYFVRTRFSPENEAKAGFKYKSPSKKQTGEGFSKLPFFTKPVINAVRSKKEIDVLGLTEGEFKAAWMSKHTPIPFVAFQGISVFELTDDLLYTILTTRPKHIIINHDADARERRGENPYKRLGAFRASVAKLAAQLLLAKKLFGLDFEIHYCIQNENQPHKGLDDLYLGSDDKEQITKDLLFFQDSDHFQYLTLAEQNFNSQLAKFFGLSINQKYQDGITISGKQYPKFLDLLQQTNISLIGQSWIVPTGFGKTYAVAHTTESDRKILVVPTISLLKDVCSQYNALPYYGQEKQGVGDLGGAPFICTTYASFPGLCERLPYAQDYDVFIDEAHNFASSTSYSFQLKELTTVLDCLPRMKSYTLLTGTKLHNTEPLLDLPQIRVTAKKDYPKTFQIIKGTDIIKTAAEAAKQAIAKGRKPIILLNNKGKKLLKLQTLLSNYKVCTINSKSKKDGTFTSITQQNKLPDCDVLITTSVLKEGNSILDEYEYQIIVVGASFGASDIEQMAARPRKPLGVHVTKLQSQNATEEPDAWCNPQRCGDYLIRKAKLTAEDFNQDSIHNTIGYKLESSVQRTFTDTHIKKSDDGTYVVDYLAINNKVFQIQNQVQNKNPKVLKRAIRDYGFRLLPDATIGFGCTQAENQLIRAKTDQAKEAKEQEFDKLVSLLEQGSISIDDCKKNNGSGHYLEQTETESHFYKAVDILAEHYPSRILPDKIKELGTSKNRLFKHKRQLEIQTVLSDKNFMGSGRALPELIKKVYAEFAIGSVASSEELKDRLLGVLRTNKTINTKAYEGERNTKALRTLRLFMDIKRRRKREGDQLVWVFEIINHNPCGGCLTPICSINGNSNNNISLMEQKAQCVLKRIS